MLSYGQGAQNLSNNMSKVRMLGYVLNHLSYISTTELFTRQVLQ